MLVLTEYVVKHELKPLAKFLTVRDLLKSSKKVLDGLGQKIAVKEYEGFTFYKVRVGSNSKARMIVFAVLGSKKVVPVLIRLKKDKKLGMNMSANNVHVVKQVDINMAKIVKDIEQGRYKEFKFLK